MALPNKFNPVQDLDPAVAGRSAGSLYSDSVADVASAEARLEQSKCVLCANARTYLSL